MSLLLQLPQSFALSRHAYSALSQAVAACCAKASAPQSGAMVEQFVVQLASASCSGDGAVLALLCLGEIGRLLDLSANARLLPTVTRRFDSADEETRAAASFALGNIAAGNLVAFVPHMLQELEGDG